MATRTFANLAPFAAQAAVQAINPLDALIQGAQQGLALRQLPQQIQNDALNQQLQQALQQAKIAELTQGKIFEVGGSLVRQNPQTGSFDTLFSTPSTSINKPFEIDGELVQLNPQNNKYESVFSSGRAPKSPFSQQQVVSLTDPKDVRFAIPDASGQPPAGYQFSKAMEQPIKPAEKLQALKFVRDVYEESPTKVSYFGKGQLPGSDEIKTRLDAVLRPVNGDFTKLNAQAKDSFLFAMNNLRDPRSATLLAESNQIAERMGLGDRFKTYVTGLETGARVSPEVAKDIYDVVSQTHALQEERLLEDLIQRKDQLNAIGSELKDIGVPKPLIDKVNARIANPQAAATPSGAPTATATTTAPTVTTKQEFDALPSGSRYIGKNGKTYQKP